jgi:hypothetical protein
MTRASLLKWLHRIGYVTTALVVAELIAISGAALYEWHRQWAFEVNARESSKTHEGPLTVRSFEAEFVARIMAPLPPLKSLQGDGYRFVAAPSFGPHVFGLAIRRAPNSTQAEGDLLVYPQDRGEIGKPVSRHFVIPASAYAAWMQRIDKAADGWPGSTKSRCLDGTGAAFERVRGQRVTSGIGNSACDDHYRQISQATLELMQRYAPGPDLPRDSEWMP